MDTERHVHRTNNTGVYTRNRFCQHFYFLYRFNSGNAAYKTEIEKKYRDRETGKTDRHNETKL